MSNIKFEYPTAYLLICLLIAILYAAFMYFRDKRWKEKSVLLPALLAVARAILVFVLCVLLLSPFLTFFEEKTESPVVVLAHDASESIQLSPDSTLNAFLENYPALVNELSSYELQTLAVGAEVKDADSLIFEDQQTNLASLFEYVERQFAGRTIGAIILASDGLYNVGQNPVYATSGLKTPLYTIPLGDTSSKRDIAIPNVYHNNIAYLNDKFNIQADIEASRLQGNEAILRVFHKREDGFKEVAKETININERDFFTTSDFTLDAEQPGMQQYRLTISRQEGEISYQNNSQDFFIDVIDSRQKILLFAAAPHPDVTAFRQLLSENDNYEIDLALAEDTDINFNSYDLIFLHQIPFQKLNNATIRQALNADAPKIFVAGLDTDAKRFNEIQSAISIEPQRGSSNAVSASLNENFNAFILEDELGNELQNYPPIETFFGEFNIRGNLNVLFYQKIGEVATEYPLFAVGEDKGNRIGFILGEGFWRWKLFDYLQNENHATTGNLIEQMVQFVSVKEDKRRFRVSTAKDLFDENERIRFRAEFFNENYELINEPEVYMTLSDEEGNNYEYTFDRERNFYTLDIGFMSTGTYTYTATTRFNGRDFTYNGRFSVESIQLEMYKTVADHNVLKLLADQNGGNMISAENMLSIPDSLENKETLTPVMYTSARTKSMINLPWVFWLLVTLMAVEWVSRRLAGTY